MIYLGFQIFLQNLVDSELNTNYCDPTCFALLESEKHVPGLPEIVSVFYGYGRMKIKNIYSNVYASIGGWEWGLKINTILLS